MAGRIPQSFIDDLLARVDIVDLIDSYVPLKHKGKEWTACCPFHHEKTPSFTVSAEKQFFHCFGCGKHGTALGFLLEFEHLDFVAAVEVLARRVGLEVPTSDDGVSKGPDLAPIYQALDDARAYFQEQLRHSPKAIEYLKGRGLSGEIARDFALGYSPEGWDSLIRHLESKHPLDVLLKAGLATPRDSGGAYDRFRDRVMFPIRDRAGRVVGFGARAMGDAQPKYLNSAETPVFSKGRQLYGWFEARKAIAQAGCVLVVEGYMDVVALVQAGVGHAVAALGTATTADHVRQLFGGTSDVLFCFDGDRAGREAAWRAAQQIVPQFEDGKNARFVFLPTGEDPDSLIRSQGRAAFDALVAQALPLEEYLFAHLKEGLDMASSADRAKLAERAKPLFARFPAGVFRTLMHQRLDQEVGLRTAASAVPAGRGSQRTPRSIARAAPERRRALGVVGTVIALLIQHPQLVGELPDAEHYVPMVDLPGMDLLVELIRLLKEAPQLSPAGLVERLRDTPHYRTASKLLAWNWPEGHDGGQEFRDAVRKIGQRLDTCRIDALESKLKQDGLTDEEKREYQQLLKNTGRTRR